MCGKIHTSDQGAGGPTHRLNLSPAGSGADIGVLTCKLKDVHNDIVYTAEAFA